MHPGRTYPMSRVFVSAIIVLLSAGCSSLPDPPDEIRTSRDRAGQYAEFGDNYYRRGEFTQARTFYVLALDLARSVDSQNQSARLHNSIGGTLQAEGRFDEAEREYRQAQRIAVRAGNPRIEADSVNNLGKVLVDRGDHAEAISLFEKSMDLLSGENEDERRESVVRHNLATALAGVGELGRARSELERALETNERLNYREELASNYYMLASIESRQGNYEAAYSKAERALELDRSMENTRGIISDLRALSHISTRLEEPENALEYLDRAISVATGSGNADTERALLEEAIPLANELDRTDYVTDYENRLDSLSGD